MVFLKLIRLAKPRVVYKRYYGNRPRPSFEKIAPVIDLLVKGKMGWKSIAKLNGVTLSSVCRLGNYLGLSSPLKAGRNRAAGHDIFVQDPSLGIALANFRKLHSLKKAAKLVGVNEETARKYERSVIDAKTRDRKYRTQAVELLANPLRREMRLMLNEKEEVAGRGVQFVYPVSVLRKVFNVSKKPILSANNGSGGRIRTELQNRSVGNRISQRPLEEQLSLVKRGKQRLAELLRQKKFEEQLGALNKEGHEELFRILKKELLLPTPLDASKNLDVNSKENLAIRESILQALIRSPRFEIHRSALLQLFKRNGRLMRRVLETLDDRQGIGLIKVSKSIITLNPMVGDFSKVNEFLNSHK